MKKKKLKALERKNVMVISEVYSSIVKNRDIQKYIEKIKSHPWVQIIENSI